MDRLSDKHEIPAARKTALKRFEATVTGRVQGVGFRPTVARYAAELGLAGRVKNDPAGVSIEVEGDERKIAVFFDRLKNSPPPQARIENISVRETPPEGAQRFEITPSRRSGDLLVGMPPDLATCDDCLAEIFNRADRRYRYPFTNCTNCGPRFTIIRELPYDRPYTSMESFEMCGDCDREYRDPADRRYDAQPNACPVCGPALKLIDREGREVSGEPIAGTAALLRKNKIVAVKGLGGYHLCCDATSDETVGALRRRKNRPAKALAVMFASLKELKKHCEVNASEENELLSTARPIVILKRRRDSNLSPLISPDTGDIGAFLPYTPLHHLLLAEASPLIMTSGNVADEPIAQDEDELKKILGGIANYALTHNRPIARRCDDSVMKVARGKTLWLRRSRGFVPDHVELPLDGPPVLACGADLKNTFCITRARRAFMSQHIGDLADYTAFRFFRESVDDLSKLLKIQPRVIAHDLHPDYLSTRYALESGIAERIAVQHHHAHIASCLVENEVAEKVIGVALDGSGYGADGTVWGGEFLVADCTDFRRVGHFKQYPLPGGEEAILHPVRMALSYLVSEAETDREEFFDSLLPAIGADERPILVKMIKSGFRSPLTSSAGRLFDAVSALLGVSTSITYEGQAATRLQAIADERISGRYDFEIERRNDISVVSFAPMVSEIICDIKKGTDKSAISGKFHGTVAEAVAETCAAVRSREGIKKVALSGGVFQNDLLLGLTIDALEKRGFEVYTHRLLPPNDACIALGQAAVALAQLKG